MILRNGEHCTILQSTPTGKLLDPLFSFGDKKLSICEVRQLAASTMTSCSVLASDWCGFTTAMPSGVVDELSTYRSAAWSCWGVHSSRASEITESCPNTWNKTGSLEIFIGNNGSTSPHIRHLLMAHWHNIECSEMESEYLKQVGTDTDTPTSSLFALIFIGSFFVGPVVRIARHFVGSRTASDFTTPSGQ
jgi:hypothetical protein